MTGEHGGPGARPRTQREATEPDRVASNAAGDPAALDRLLLRSIRDYAIYRLDPHGVVQTWNTGAEQLKGYAPHEIIGRHFSVFFTPEEVAAHQPERELEIAERTGSCEAQGWRVRKDGTRFWADVVLTALRNQDGELVGFAKVTRDLTERRRAEEAARALASESAARAAAEAERERLRWQADLLEQANVALIVWTIEEGIVYWNHGAEALYGYPREEARGKVPHDLLHSVPAGCTIEQVERTLVDTGQWSGEIRHRTRRGDLVWVDSRMVLVRPAEAPPYVFESNRDVTERVAAREAEQRMLVELRERAHEEAALRLIAQQLTAASRIPEVMHHVVEGALAVSEAVGAYIEQVVSPGGEVEVVASAGTHTPPCGQRVPYPGSLTEEIIARGEPVFLTHMQGIGAAIAPYLMRDCSGCSVLVVPLLSGNDVLGALVLLRGEGEPPFEHGIIGRVRTLGNLASMALHRLVLFLEAERRRRDAEAAVRSRDEMLSVVSHDLRNPVHTITMSAALLRDLPLDHGEQGKQLDIILRSTERMNRLITDLLDAARIEGGRFAISKRCEDPCELAREVCEAHQRMAQQNGQTLRTTLPDRVARICADRDRVLQLLSNYVGNALKFTPAGGQIIIDVSETSGNVCFAVMNTGGGISADELPHLFDRYWQSRRTAHLGAGLGLAISKGIAEAHAGRVWAESDPGRSATFFFEMAADSACNEQQPGPAR